MFLDLLLRDAVSCSYDGRKFRESLSAYLSEFKYEPTISPSVVRTVFTETTLAEVKPADNHTHGLSAAARNSASLFIDSMAMTLGRRVVFYQGSASDVRNGRVVSRSHHWVKDTNVLPVVYDPAPDDLVAMVDVDEYVDMPRFLSQNFRPVLIYTFQPSNVARTTGEYKYTFDDDDSVTYVVSGGATYKHKVWNYDGDSLKIKQYWCGILVELLCFALERRQVDEDHQLILITPVAKYKGEQAWVADRVLGGKELQRLKVANGGFTRMFSNTPDGMTVHTGITGNYIACSVPAQVDSALAVIAKLQSGELTLSSVKSVAKLDNDNMPAALWAYHRAGIEWKGATVATANKHVHRFQCVKTYDAFETDAKPSVEGFMFPLLDGAYAPDMCKSNDQRSIDTRVTAVKNDIQPDAFLIRVMKEFVSEFVGDSVGLLRPVEVEDVFLRQNTPRQRKILEYAGYSFEANRVVKAFMKREAGQNVSDPRNISTINGVDKLDWSKFMYPFADFMKTKDYYAFGRSPKEIAERVASVAERAETIIETDFSRMDGRVNGIARTLEKMVMMRLFHSSYHNQLFELLRSQYNLTGKTKHGVSYDTGLSRLSGSPETSVFNTLLNIFTAFLALRMTKKGGAYITPSEAITMLGVYGGDDGISANIESDVYTRAAKRVGQKLTCDVKSRGSAGIKFLARLYGPEVWFGNSNSMCDLPRTLSKFHTTVHLPNSITAEEKLIDKAHALSLTDSNTPIVGTYVREVLKHRPATYEFKNLGRKWMPEERPDLQYPNKFEDWMLDEMKQSLPEFSYGQFNDWVNGCSNLSDLMKCPKFHPTIEAKPLKGCVTVVNGEVVEELPPLMDAEELKENAQTATLVSEPTMAAPTKKRFRPRKKKKDRSSRLSDASAGASVSPRQAPNESGKHAKMQRAA